MWRRMEIFETENYLVYCPTRYTQFLRSVRPLMMEVAMLGKLYVFACVCLSVCSCLIVYRCCLCVCRPGGSVDETAARRQKQKQVAGQLHRKNMARCFHFHFSKKKKLTFDVQQLWTPMQWAPRVAYWCNRQIKPFTHKVPDRVRTCCVYFFFAVCCFERKFVVIMFQIVHFFGNTRKQNRSTFKWNVSCVKFRTLCARHYAQR